jgi:hypothetical protein
MKLPLAALTFVVLAAACGGSATTVGDVGPSPGTTTVVAESPSPTPAPDATRAPDEIVRPAPTKRPTPTQPPITPRPSSGTSSSSGVRGTVHAGPTCPVERADQPCADRPVTGARVQAQRSGTNVVSDTKTDGQGRYAITLPPGDYVLTVTTDQAMSCDQPTARVVRGKITTVDIACDTGIR